MDPPPLLPKVIARLRKARFRVTVGHQEIGHRYHQRWKKLIQEHSILGVPEVLPQGLEHGGRLVFLKGDLRDSVDDPRMPSRAERAVRPVFLKKHGVIERKHALAKAKEPTSRFMDSQPIENPADVGLTVEQVLARALRV